MIESYRVNRSNSQISIFIITFIWFIFISLYFLDITLVLSDFYWSTIFVTIILVIYFLRYINKINNVSLYSLFFLTTLLFLGGRFLSIFLGYKDNPLFEITFFTYHKLNDYESSMLFYWVIIGILSMEIGLYISKIFINARNTYDLVLHNNQAILYIILAFLFIWSFQQIIANFQLVLNYGYVAFFSNQGELTNYTYNSSALILTLTTASVGIFLVQDNRKLRILCLVLLGLANISAVIMGGRSGFSSFMLFLIWYFYNKGLKRANFLKIFFYLVFLLIFLSKIIGFFTLRDLNIRESSMYDQILSFLYGQGITLMVFNEAMITEDYPINAYFQNFIAGFSFFYSRLVEDIPFYKLSLNAYNSYSINSAEFLQGYGMGWSLFSDAYLHGFRNPILYSIFLAVFSYLLNYLQINLNKSIYSKIIAISLFIPIMTLPRAGLNNVIPIAYYVIVMYWVIRSFDKRSNY